MHENSEESDAEMKQGNDDDDASKQIIPNTTTHIEMNRKDIDKTYNNIKTKYENRKNTNINRKNKLIGGKIETLAQLKHELKWKKELIENKNI